jgi:hypothetical protein
MASGLTPWLALELPEDVSQITNEQLAEWKKKQALAKIAAQGCNVLYEELGLRRRMNFYFEFKSSCEWKNLGYLKTVRMGKELLKKDVSKAFSEVKATSRAHDKKVALNTNKNYNAMQAAKPWASAEEVLAFNRGRGSPRGRGVRSRGGFRSGNDGNPRFDNPNPGGTQFGYQSGNQGFQNRGNFNQFPKNIRGNQSNNGGRGNNNPNNSGNRGFPQKHRPQNRGNRGGGN